MRFAPAAVVFAVVIPVVIASACISPSNPYDEDTPRDLQARATLHGTVTLAGDPTAAQITLTEGGTSTTTDAGDDGAYSIDLAPGTYALVVATDGAAEFSRSVVLAPGSNVTLDVTLDDNVPPQAATILIGDGAALTSDPTPTIVVDAQGAVAVELSVSTPEGDTTEPVRFEEALPLTVEDLDLGVDGDKVVVARFVDENGFEAVAQASVELDTTAPVLGATPIQVQSNGGFISSVSTTVSFEVEGAAELALAITAGANPPEAHEFQPFSPDITVLLPAVECAGPSDAGCIEVCATFRDRAGNTTSTPVCDEVTLDTTAPAAPLIIEDDTVVSTTAFSLHLVDIEADAFPVEYQVLVDPAAPTYVPALETVDADGNLEVALTLTPPTSADPATAATPNVVRLRSVDAAGNTSPESAITIIVDDVAPAAPLLAGVPAQTDADTVSVNFLGDNAADDDATFHHYAVQTTLLPAPFDTTLRDGILVSLLPERENTISVVAVDAAGNTSAAASVTLRHDSEPPTAPTISPVYAEVRKGPVEIGINNPSRDTQVVNNQNVTNDVSFYQLKDGVGASFKRVPAGEPMFAELRMGRENDVCVRGVDEANNVGIEDCVVIAETSMRDISSTADQVHAFDVFGDFMFFTSGGAVFVRDLRTGDDTPIAPNSGAFRDSYSGHFHASGDPRRAVLLYESPGGRVTLVDAQLSQSPPTIGVWQIFGSAPYVRGNEMVYLLGAAPNQTVRYRSATLNLLVDPSQPFNPDPAVQGVDVSGPTTLCPGTGPRVANGVIVWCAIDGSGAPEIRAYTVGQSALGGERVNELEVAMTRGGSITGDTPHPQQPLIADGMIAWAEEVVGTARVVYVRAGVGGGPDLMTRTRTQLSADDLHDLSRGVFADVKVYGGITSDIAFGNLNTGAYYDQINNDTAPQAQPTLDDTRLFFSDTARGEQIRMFDVSTLRWVRATSSLAFDPVTSAEVTAWIEGIGGEIRLVARALPIDAAGHDVVEVDGTGDASVAFFGPSKADPTYAAGGRRVAFLVGDGPTYSIVLRELDASGAALPARILVPTATSVFAIDPDGDALVYLDVSGTVQRIDLPAVLPTTLSETPVAMAGAGPIRFLDIDDDVVVAQRNGFADRADEASGQGEAYCSSGGVSALVGTEMRGPKVAHLQNGSYLFAAGTTSDIAARYCTLRCADPTPCVLADASSSRGRDMFVQVARDGRIAYLNDEQVLTQVVIFDTFARRWTFATLGDVEHTGLSASNGRVVWSDPSLGGYAVFELTTTQ